MPRPLIIKVESHKSQPNKKATGSIDVQLLKTASKASLYDSYNFENDTAPFVADNEQPEENGSKSIVRNLISRYEPSTNTKVNLIKYKSKSLADLQKPQVSVTTKRTQDDFLYSRNKYNNDESEGQKFDFKKVFQKFETSSHSDIKRTVTTNQSVTQVKNYKISNSNSNYNSDSCDLDGIKQKAKILLEQRQHSLDYSSWQNQVVELLQHIETLGGSTTSTETKQEWTSSYINKSEEKTSFAAYKDENTLKRAKSLDSGELNKNLKVKNIRNIFETKVDDPKKLSRSISSSYATYFGLKSAEGDNAPYDKVVYSQRGINATPFNGDYENNEMETEKSDDSDTQEEEGSYEFEYGKNREINSDVIEGNRIITQPVLASSAKIRQLKNFFESEPDKYVPYEKYAQNEENKPEEVDKTRNFWHDSTETGDIHVVEHRMIPPPKMIVLDDNNQTDGNIHVVNSKQQIKEITKNIEDYEDRIANLSKENTEEGSYLNEVLIRVLIKLDDIKTYGDEVIVTERKRAIQFVQSCIKKLRQKIHGTQ